MKFYLNTLFFVFLSLFMVGCSSMNDWDVSKIIDKTENWLFDKEEDSGEKEVNFDEFDDQELTEEKVEAEEVFPDINDVPQIKPEFEQIDEDFFESEETKSTNTSLDVNNMEVSQINKQDNTTKENV